MSSNFNYNFEDYTDNWSNWQNNFPNIPLGVNGELGFAVPNPDGSLNTQDYPIAPGTNSPAQPGCNGFAVGGWNASQPGGGLYQILTQALQGGNLTAAQQNLVANIVAAAKQNGYQNVIVDYENYSNPPADPAIYTKFLQELGSQLHQAGMTLEIAMSPNPENERYYDLPALVNSGAVDHFQAMCYDYAQGQSSPVTIEANSGVQQTEYYLNGLKGIIPPSKLKIGVALYGISYTIQPGMSLQQIEEGLKSGSLKGSYTDPTSPIINDDDILKAIGSWTNPKSPWALVNDGQSPPNYFYYNSTTGTMISAFPPQSMSDFANMIKQNFPDVAGFFCWDADADRTGAMMQTLVDDFVGNAPPPVATCISEFEQWLGSLRGVSPSWISQLKAELEANPPTSTDEFTQWLNGVFGANSGGNQDLYMQTGLLYAAPGGNVINQITSLFSEFPNFLPLNLQIPQPTFADTAYAQALSWQPSSSGGQNLKEQLLSELQNKGSSLQKSALDSWAYQLNPSVYSGMSAQDSAQFTAITGAWL